MRSLVLRTAEFTAPLTPLNLLIRLTAQQVYRPYYHTIAGDYALPHIEHIYEPRTVKCFIKDIDYLLKFFEPINLTQMHDIARTGKTPRKPCFFLSFDDGLREVYDIAMPILLSKGVTATTFLNSSFVDNKDLFFRYKASLLIDKLRKKSVSDATVEEIYTLIGSTMNHPSDLTKALLSIRYQDRHLLDAVAETLDVDFVNFLNSQKPYMNSLEIESMSRAGFEFGAHSVDHPLYGDLTLEEQLRQTEISSSFVQKNFNSTTRSFAFPFSDHGVDRKFFETLTSNNVVDIVFAGKGFVREKSALEVNRHAMERGQTPIDRIVKSHYLLSLKRMAFNN